MSTITDEQLRAIEKRYADRNMPGCFAQPIWSEVETLQQALRERDATIAELRDKTFCEVEPEGESHDISAGMICFKCSNAVCEDRNSLRDQLAQLREKSKWRRCAATISTDPPSDCDAPFCGCNPEWHVALDAARESGWLTSAESSKLQGALAELRKPVAFEPSDICVQIREQWRCGELDEYSVYDALDKSLTAYETLAIEVAELRKPVAVERNHHVEQIRSRPREVDLGFGMKEMLRAHWGDIDVLLSAYDALAQDCAKYANAHDVHMAEIRGLRERLERSKAMHARAEMESDAAHERERQLRQLREVLEAFSRLAQEYATHTNGCYPVDPAKCHCGYIAEHAECCDLYDAALAQPQAATYDQGAAHPPLHLNCHQIDALREFTDGDPLFTCCLAALPARTAIDGEPMEAGLYCWSADYPDEGVLLLPAEPVAQPQWEQQSLGPNGECPICGEIPCKPGCQDGSEIL